MNLKDNRGFLWFMFLSILTFLVMFFPVSISKASVYSPSKIKVIKLNKAEIIVKKKYGNINDIDLVLRDLKKVLIKYNISNNDFKRVVVDDVVLDEKSYIFLVMASIAFKESNFDKDAIGKLHEIGTYQLLPSTVRSLSNELPVKINTNKKLSNEQCTIFAIYYVQKHLTNKNGNLIDALSRYNGDKTKRYGKKVNKLFKDTLKFT